jgi:hypothetical protein
MAMWTSRRPSRTAAPYLLAAMLERWEQVATQAIIDQVDAVPGPAEARLRALFAVALASSRMALETALHVWGRREKRVQRAVERVDERRLAYLQAPFEELGLPAGESLARAFLAYSMLSGDHFIAATGEPPRKALLEECAALLLTDARRR